MSGRVLLRAEPGQLSPEPCLVAFVDFEEAVFADTPFSSDRPIFGIDPNLRDDDISSVRAW